MRQGVHSFLLLIFFLIASEAFTGELEDAMAMESSGNVPQALPLYLEWLDANSGKRQFSDVLLHTASLYENPLESLNSLEHYLPELDVGDIPEVLALMAGLESSLGILGKAAFHFKRASESDSSKSDQWFYDSLSLRFVMGEYSELRPDALFLAENAREPFLRDKAAALAAVSLAYSGGSSDAASTALDELNRYINKNPPISSPLVWFSLHKLALLEGDSQSLKRSTDEMNEEFPSSMVTYITDSKLSEWDSPSMYIFTTENPAGKSVQVGAFSSRDAAASLRFNLDDDNFVAWIEKSGEVWRVFVNDPSGDAVSRLIAAGYDSLF